MRLYTALRNRYGAPDGLTRREMLARSMAAGAGLLLSNHLPFGRAQAAGGRVVIIGAGFGGLATASELYAAGYDVVVVEARNRVGGRVLSFKDVVPGKNMEGGAELIGANHPTWAAYKERFRLEFLDVVEEKDLEQPIVLGGRRLSEAEAEALWHDIERAVRDVNADAERIVDPFRPWTTSGAEAFDGRTVGQWIASLNVSDLCKAGVDAALSSDAGVHVSWQSYLAHLAMVKGHGVERFWTETESFRCRGGNQQLAQHLAATLPSDRILLRTPVRSIEVRETSVRVTLTDGRALEADHAVLTAPPSVWSRIAFDPLLPPWLTIQMNANVKWLASFRRPFWRLGRVAPDLLSDGPINQTWHGTDGQIGPPSVGLVAFSGGNSADQTREWSATERNQRYLAELSRVYPGIASDFVSARYMDWPSDPWSKASYSFTRPGQITTSGPTLVEGLGRLHFAGEYTCFAFPGYMEGALNSGVRMARTIAQRDGVARIEDSQEAFA